MRVRDTLRGFQAGAEVQTHWLVGDGLAWAFSEGRARLSDGKHILWIEPLQIV
ncbi:MAG: hypothetical protein NZ602_11185 [Thermoguttaceae bacterium]|nr:hypothetical protein [Thermoguttaceae bacterium]MDW8037875.1 hypothetical protein [Thermoguttaceae bacterium]